MNPKIIIRDLYKFNANNTCVLNNINIEIEENSIFGLLGREYSGNSTLLQIMAMQEVQSSGFISIFGFGFDKKEEIRNLNSFCSTTFSFYDSLTFIENINMFREMYSTDNEVHSLLINRMSGKIMERRIFDIKIERLNDTYKRILNLTIAILKNKKILFIDLPTCNVEEEFKPLIWDIIRNYYSLGRTIIFTTNNIDEAEELAGENYVIVDRGMIIT